MLVEVEKIVLAEIKVEKITTGTFYQKKRSLFAVESFANTCEKNCNA